MKLDNLEQELEKYKIKYEGIFSYNQKDGYRLFCTNLAIIKSIKKLSPFITEIKNYHKILVDIYVYANDLPKEFHNELGKVEKITIDTSLYEDLRTDGLKYGDKEYYLIHINKTSTEILFNRKKNKIHIFNKNVSLAELDSIRLLKSLISLHQENVGNIILHASGIVTKEKAGVLFLGDSRNGKTSILLEFLEKFRGDMLSCDTSVLEIYNNKLKARGWPSNFSVSIGTIYDYKCLHKFTPKETKFLTYNQAWSIYPKHVLDTIEVLSNTSSKIYPSIDVSVIVFLRFSNQGPVGVEKVYDKIIIRDWIKKVYLGSKDPLYPNWHNFWEISEAQIDKTIDIFVQYIIENNIPVYEMTWAPGPEQLLRKIDILNECNLKNIHLSNI